MTPTIGGEALLGIVAFGALVIFWLGPLRWFVNDLAREMLFTAREKLFDVAAGGKIAFDDPAYVLVRERVNGTIRFMHELTLLHMLLHVRTMTKKGPFPRSDSVREAVDRIVDPQARAVAENTLRETGTTLLLAVFLKSPFLSLWFTFALVGPKALLQRRSPGSVTRAVQEKLRPYVEALQTEATLNPA
jgi:hypothetical protein